MKTGSTGNLGIISLIVFLLLSFFAGAVGAVFTAGAVDGWYQELRKPFFTPPEWVFAPVWTALYVSMAFGGWLVWRRRQEKVEPAVLFVYASQLFLNGLWSPLFFGLRQLGWAAVDILLLWILIIIFVFLSWRISKPASILFIPYLLWVSFAAILNLDIWISNPS